MTEGVITPGCKIRGVLSPGACTRSSMLKVVFLGLTRNAATENPSTKDAVLHVVLHLNSYTIIS